MVAPQKAFDAAAALLEYCQTELHLTEREAVGVMGIALQSLINDRRTAQRFMSTLAAALDKSIGTTA